MDTIVFFRVYHHWEDPKPYIALKGNPAPDGCKAWIRSLKGTRSHICWFKIQCHEFIGYSTATERMSNNWYLGSIVLECKYRKINSFWNENSQRSSIGQLQAYYNNTRSEFLFGGKGKRFNARPVRKVIVLTPDTVGDGKSQDDFNILVKGLKPTSTEEWSESLIEELKRTIRELKEASYDLRH